MDRLKEFQRRMHMSAHATDNPPAPTVRLLDELILVITNQQHMIRDLERELSKMKARA
jgi:hypothetical protein